MTKRRWGVRRIAGRGLFLIVAFVSLYLLWPSIGEVFDQWRSLTELKPQWVVVALGVETLSFVAVWELQRIALQTKRWFPVATSQLAGQRLRPGHPRRRRGGRRPPVPHARPRRAPGRAHRLVADRGLGAPLRGGARPPAPQPARDPRRDAGRLRPRSAPHTSERRSSCSCSSGAQSVFVWDRPLAAVGECGRASRSTRLFAGEAPLTGLRSASSPSGTRCEPTFGRRWQAAVLAAAGKSIFDYLALVACLRAVGAEPNPSLILLAYVASAILAMIPFTPGGLGFVEAGLVGMLILAGVGRTAAAVADARLPARLLLAPDPGRRGGLRALPLPLSVGLELQLLADLQDADVHVGSQLRGPALELAHRLGEERGRLPAGGLNRVVGPPVDRHRDARAAGGQRLGGAARVEMPRPQGGPQPQIGTSARSSPGASSAISGKRSVSPGK